jgi:hypothetical protein
MTNEGELWAMGRNGDGELGDGTVTNRSAPVRIATGAVAIAAGSSYSHPGTNQPGYHGHGLYVTGDGKLWTMGSNTFGQLGDSTTASRSTPVQVAENVSSIAAGYGHSLYVTNDGKLWAMGYNEHGQLGNGKWDMACATPVRITPITLYVSPDGNDNNDGEAPATAKKTLHPILEDSGQYVPAFVKISGDGITPSADGLRSLIPPGIILNFEEGVVFNDSSLRFPSELNMALAADAAASAFLDSSTLIAAMDWSIADSGTALLSLASHSLLSSGSNIHAARDASGNATIVLDHSGLSAVATLSLAHSGVLALTATDSTVSANLINMASGVTGTATIALAHSVLSADATLSAGSCGTALITAIDGSTISSGSTIIIAGNAGSSVSIVLDGSTLSARRIASGGGRISLSLAGATIRTTGTGDSFLNTGTLTLHAAPGLPAVTFARSPAASPSPPPRSTSPAPAPIQDRSSSPKTAPAHSHFPFRSTCKDTACK